MSPDQVVAPVYQYMVRLACRHSRPRWVSLTRALGTAKTESIIKRCHRAVGLLPDRQRFCSVGVLDGRGLKYIGQSVWIQCCEKFCYTDL